MCVWELKETNVVRVYFPAWINVEYLQNDTWCLELVYSRLSLISQMWQKKKRHLKEKFISLFILSKDFQVFHKKLPEHDAMIHPKLIFLNTETPPLH